jgi:glycosyltransferase involved in cell wall biosynthesis
MNILWLASWYPSKINSLAGDFVERHARAAALFDNTVVIHVVKDPFIRNGKSRIEKITYSQDFTALICYYPAYRRMGKLFENLFSSFLYIKMHFQAYALYKRLFGRPKGILVQVAIKAGIIALLWRYIFGIKYVVFERWSGLLKEAKPNYTELGLFYKKLWKLVFRKAEQIVTVTESFSKGMVIQLPKKKYTVIPNVVMDDLFVPRNQPRDAIFRLIHVSTLDYPKNFEDILLAVQVLKHQLIKFEMLVYGQATEDLKLLTAKLDLENTVHFKGEVTHKEIAQAMQASQALILYSRYETFGNVIIEANACGIPVIVSDLPVFHEILVEGVTGVFVEGENPGKLAEKILWLMENYHTFKPEIIHNYVRQRYNQVEIGSKFHQLFKSAFKKQ